MSSSHNSGHSGPRFRGRPIRGRQYGGQAVIGRPFPGRAIYGRPGSRQPISKHRFLTRSSYSLSSDSSRQPVHDQRARNTWIRNRQYGGQVVLGRPFPGRAIYGQPGSNRPKGKRRSFGDWSRPRGARSSRQSTPTPTSWGSYMSSSDSEAPQPIVVQADQPSKSSTPPPAAFPHLQNKKVPREDRELLSAVGYDVCYFIGKGGFGDVFSGVCNDNAYTTDPVDKNEVDINQPLLYSFDENQNSYVKLRCLIGEPCAIKLFKFIEFRENEVYRELNAQKDLNHPNIVKVYMVCRTELNVYLIMEYLNGKTLKMLLEEYTNRKLDEWTALQMIRQLLAGLVYLHSKNIVHQDLHMSNIMLTSKDNNMVLKIVDFGCAKAIDATDPKVDINMFGYVTGQIMNKTHFVRSSVERGLRFVVRCIDQKIIPNVAQLENRFNQEVPNVGPPSATATALSKFSRFFKK